jgi:hypothetical protein
MVDVRLGVGVRVCEGVDEVVGVREIVGVGVLEGVNVIVGVGVMDGVRVGVTVIVVDGVGVAAPWSTNRTASTPTNRSATAAVSS